MPPPTPDPPSPRPPPPDPGRPRSAAARSIETLADGRQVEIRPLTRADAEADRDFIEGLSPQSRRDRFLGQVSSACAALVQQLTDLDGVHRVAYAAAAPVDDGTRIVGVARYGADPDGRRAECAIAVADEWHQVGLGTALMSRLIEHARAQGLDALYSLDTSGNVAMRELAADLGFRRMRDPGDAAMVRHELDLRAN